MEHKHKDLPCQIALQLSAEEADALLNLLLCAPTTDEVPEEMTSQLLRRVAEAQRALVRPARIESGHDPRSL